MFFSNFTFLASYYKIACGLSLETVSYDSCDQIRGTVVFAHPVWETSIRQFVYDTSYIILCIRHFEFDTLHSTLCIRHFELDTLH